MLFEDKAYKWKSYNEKPSKIFFHILINQRHITPAITGEKARSGFESSAKGAMVDGDVRRQR